ncbi:MAG: AGE family epimerase/isomerase [Oscillospiraceae bacterium]|jgi:mannobiose 2-epimerase|nr:AGE family epimerase/isomerase [Oscillospiraceae bacterium]
MSGHPIKERAFRLLDGIIPFWQGLRDREHGGFYGFMDIDLKLNKKADKGCILNSRILWFFSEAARTLKQDGLLDDASHAYRFLLEHCLDKEHGGVFWSVTYDGQPAETIKHTYNQAFAVYALSAYYEASGDKNALTLAEELFALIEDRCTDEGGYLEAFDRSFSPIENEKLSENGVTAYRTMNTLLHVFEAYSGLYRAAKSPVVAEKMRRILDTFEHKVYNPKLKRQEVFFDKDWNSIIDLTSYGHDIESSWLVEWGASLLGEDRVTVICSALAENVYDKAFRENSLRNECESGREDERRIWWVQAEAVVGFLNKGYRQAAEGILTFIEDKMVDKRPGSEWLSEVMPDGSHTEWRKPVVEEWKCPYHNGRMCLEILRRYP